jgi:hypothetical protein
MAYDNRVGMIKFTRASDGAPAAALVTWIAHETGFHTAWWENRTRSSHERASQVMLDIMQDYKPANPDFIALFLQGGSGDCEPYDKSKDFDSYQTMQTSARSMATWVRERLDKVELQDVLSIKSFISSANGKRAQGVAFNNIAVCGTGGEMFFEIMANAKAHSPFPHTFACGYIDGGGYFGSDDAFVMKDEGTDYGYTIDKASGNGRDVEQGFVKALVEGLNGIYPNAIPQKFTPAAATASSSSSGHGPELAYDGNESKPAWYAADNAFPRWLQLDLGSSKRIAKVIMNFGGFWRLEAAKDYTIAVSDNPDFASSTTVVTQTDNLSAIVAHWISPVVSGRYVRFSCTAADGAGKPQYPSVYEMEVYGYADGVNIAQAASSRKISSRPAAAAISKRSILITGISPETSKDIHISLLSVSGRRMETGFAANDNGILVRVQNQASPGAYILHVVSEGKELISQRLLLK